MTGLGKRNPFYRYSQASVLLSCSVFCQISSVHLEKKRPKKQKESHATYHLLHLFKETRGLIQFRKLMNIHFRHSISVLCKPGVYCMLMHSYDAITWFFSVSTSVINSTCWTYQSAIMKINKRNNKSPRMWKWDMEDRKLAPFRRKWIVGWFVVCKLSSKNQACSPDLWKRTSSKKKCFKMLGQQTDLHV